MPATTSRPEGGATQTQTGPAARRSPLARALAIPASAALGLLLALGPASAAAFAATGGGDASGADGGWGPLISTLQSLVYYGGGIGILIGCAVLGLSGASQTGKALGTAIIGTAVGGVLLAMLAPSIAGLFTQWI